MSRSFSPGFYRLGRWLTRQTLGRLYGLKVQGLEYLPAQGPAIICPKHQRWEDIPMVGAALPLPLHYIAKVELFQYPFIRELLGAWGGVPVDRDRPRATLSSFKRLLPILKDRGFLVLFPEGTYVPGQVGPGKHRLIQLLLKLQKEIGLETLPFVPVGLTYQPCAWGCQVEVKIGPPLNATHPKQAQTLTDALMTQIARLCG
jgi:1-acyl-sn-glycerol-3-phosphate acyltransferase